MTFEPQAAPRVSGEFSAELFDPVGETPDVSIIRRTDPWEVHASWKVTGTWVSGLNPNARWRISVRAESLGEGYEGEVGTYEEAVGGPSSLLEYPDRNISIPAASTLTDPQGRAFTEGPYKVAVTLTLKNGNVPVMMAGYHEFTVVQFYDFP